MAGFCESVSWREGVPTLIGVFNEATVVLGVGKEEFALPMVLFLSLTTKGDSAAFDLRFVFTDAHQQTVADALQIPECVVPEHQLAKTVVHPWALPVRRTCTVWMDVYAGSTCIASVPLAVKVLREGPLVH